MHRAFMALLAASPAPSSPVAPVASGTWKKHGRHEKYIVNSSHKPVQKVGMEGISGDTKVKLSICSGIFREGNWKEIFGNPDQKL